MSSVIADMPIRELASNIRDGALSSVDALSHYLNRLKKIDRVTNCVTQFNNEEALFEQAKYFDLNRHKFKEKMALYGVPMTVKDAMKLKGFICAKGSRGLENFRPEDDATIVKRIKEAGALILGQTNVPELLLSFDTDNDLYGLTSNPHNLAHSAGGSSGGEAAAIAAGGSPVGLASDAAGSVRVPAHFCGVNGLKVTHGRLPSSGSIPKDGPGVSSRFTSFGLMSRWIDDLQYLLEVTAGPDGIDPYCQPVTLRSYRDINIKSLKIAYHHEALNGSVESCIATAIKNSAMILRDEVAKCDEFLPENFHDAYYLLFEKLLLGGDEGKSWLDIKNILGIETPSRLFQEFYQHAQKVKFSLTDFRHSLSQIDQYCFELLRNFKDYDVLLCPVSATTAPLHGSVMKNPSDFSFTMPFSLSGWPVVVVPIGVDKNKLPIGVQVVAKPWHEDTALSVAKYLEDALGGSNSICRNII